MDQNVTVKDRWLAALAYVGCLVFIPMLASNKSPFLARHCRQGFAVFCTEVLGIAFLLIVDATFGAIPVLGALVMVLLRLILFLAFLIISALGFSKSLFGESWRIPYLDDWAERIPIH